MSVHPAAMYDELLVAPPEQVVLRRDDGHVTPLALDRWLGQSNLVDEAVAQAAVGPVLDIGCGPGRLLDALARHGHWALGVDLSPVAVGLARRRGRRAVLGSVFDDLPGVGDWATALLLDGNIGIGGDAAVLLARVRTLLRPGGSAIVEVEPPGAGTRGGRVRLEQGDVTSLWFPWAHVDADGIRELADVADLRCIGGRWFAWVA
ncbi:MAG: class I SAM-dependent methyltransferase [Solirubrobacteraceae bacterium]